MKRRHFLFNSAWFTSGLTISPFFPLSALAQSSSEDPHYLVMIRASGGAHAPLGLDPFILSELQNRKIDPVKIDTGDSSDLTRFYAAYRDSDLLTAGELTLGIAAAPLIPHINDIAIINGVMLLPQSPFHDVCLRYSSSGNTKEDTPLFPYQVEMDMPERSSLGVAYSGFLNQDLKQKYFGTPIGDIASRASGSQTSYMDLLEIQNKNMKEESSLSKAMTALFDTKNREKVFAQNLSEYRSMQTGALSQDIFTLAAGFNSNYFQFASLDISFQGTLDTHSNHAQGHPQALSSVFQELADIFRLFKNIPCQNSSDGRSLFDQTTFVFTSDFCRSSWRQGVDGTDHNPLNNSFLLAGKKIKGGQKIGNSTIITPNMFPSDPRSRLQALPFDFGKGRALTLEETVSGEQLGIFNAASGKITLGQQCQRGETPGPNCIDFLTPGSIYKTLGQAFGIDYGTRYTNSEKIIPNLIKES